MNMTPSSCRHRHRPLLLQSSCINDILFSLLFFIHSVIPSIHAFPSMLEESKSGCLLDLLDPEDVIINDLVVPHEQSSRPDFIIQ